MQLRAEFKNAHWIFFFLSVQPSPPKVVENYPKPDTFHIFF